MLSSASCAEAKGSRALYAIFVYVCVYMCVYVCAPLSLHPCMCVIMSLLTRTAIDGQHRGRRKTEGRK